MNNTDLVKNKLFDPATRNQSYENSEAVLHNHETVIARVTVCLTPHHKCTGRYSDFSRSFSIICDCLCHTSQGKAEDKSSDVL